MAKFGSYNNSFSPYMSWYAEYSYSRTSNSNVSVTVTVYGEILNHSASSWMGTGNGITVAVTVGGTTKTVEIKSSSNVWQGNTNNPRSCSFSFNVSSGAAGQSISVSYSVTGSGYTAAATVPTQSTSFSSPALLYTASSLFTSSIVDNAYTDTVYATITRQNSSMTHKLVYTCNGHSVTHTNVSTSDSLTIPPEWVTDSVSAIVYVSCETFYGGTSVGTSSDYAKILVTTSAVPSITSKAYEIVDGKFGLCVAGYSKIKWSATAAGASGSTIIEGNVTGGGYTVALDGTTGILYDSGDITFTIWARDSRGRTCSTTQTISVQAYAKPTVSVTGTQRCLQDGTIDDDGTYLRCMGTATYDTVGDKNTCSYKLSYRKLGETIWSASYDWTPGTATVIGGGNINPDVAYEVRYQAADQLATAYYVDQIPNKKYLIDAYEDDNGVQSLGFGGAAKEDGKTTVYTPLTCLGLAQLTAGQWVHRAYGTHGTQSYVKIAEITIHGMSLNMGFSFDIIQRGYVYPARLSVMFAGAPTTDPGLTTMEVYGWLTKFWIRREDVGKWALYAYKVEPYDEIDVVGFWLPPYLHNWIRVAFVDEPVDSIDGATRAVLSSMRLLGVNNTLDD